MFVWLGWAVSAVGVMLFIYGCRRRGLARPVCRRCGHPFGSTANLVGSVCTECGSAVRSQKDSITQQRSLLIASIGLVIGVAGLSLGVGSGNRTALLKLVTPRYRVDSTTSTGHATIRILEPFWSDDVGSRVEVEVGGKLAYQTDMWHPEAGEVAIPAEDGDMVHALWIRSSTGGSGGYSTTYVFSVEAGPGESGLLPLAVLQNGAFDSPPETETVVWLQPDLTYRYRWTTASGSPVPMLRAEFTVSGALVFLDPPAGSGPSSAELEAIKTSLASREIDDHARNQTLADTLGVFFDLVYAGRAAEAWQFFRACHATAIARIEADPRFASERMSREAWEREIHDAMRTSPFWPELERINGRALEPPNP